MITFLLVIIVATMTYECPILAHCRPSVQLSCPLSAKSEHGYHHDVLIYGVDIINMLHMLDRNTSSFISGHYHETFSFLPPASPDAFFVWAPHWRQI